MLTAAIVTENNSFMLLETTYAAPFWHQSQAKLSYALHLNRKSSSSDPGIEMEGLHKDGTLAGDKTRGYLPPPAKYFEAS